MAQDKTLKTLPGFIDPLWAAQAAKNFVAQAIYRSIYPVGYAGITKNNPWLKRAPSDYLSNLIKGREESWPSREDAWRKYLGLLEKYNTFEESPYKPTIAQDKAAKYVRMQPYWKELRKIIPFLDELPDESFYNYLKTVIDSKRSQGIDPMGVMGRHKISQGQDVRGPYFSYYDRWDLDKNPIEGKEGLFGTPFEIYDRLYYNPNKKTFYWKDNTPVEKRLKNAR